MMPKVLKGALVIAGLFLWVWIARSLIGQEGIAAGWGAAAVIAYVLCCGLIFRVLRRWWFWAIIALAVALGVQGRVANSEKQRWADVYDRVRTATVMSPVPPPYGKRGSVAVFGDNGVRWPQLEAMVNDVPVRPENVATAIVLKGTRGVGSDCLTIETRNGVPYDSHTRKVYDWAYTATAIDVRTLTIIGVSEYTAHVDSQCREGSPSTLVFRLIDPSVPSS